MRLHVFQSASAVQIGVETDYRLKFRCYSLVRINMSGRVVSDIQTGAEGESLYI